jgi:hypothetical protein
MFSTLNMPISMSFIAVVLSAIAIISAVLEIGIINGSQAQILQKTSPATSLPSTSPPPSSPTRPSPTNTTAITPALKSKICDPNNPKLAFVNTTESHICGIPKTIKNVTTAAATPSSVPVPTPKPILPTSPKPITPPSENPPQEAPIPGLP